MRLIKEEQVRYLLDEYIDRTGADTFTKYHIFELLDDCDAIEAEPVRHGRWIEHDDMFGRSVECSECHIETCGETPRCPVCGAKMDKGDE